LHRIRFVKVFGIYCAKKAVTHFTINIVRLLIIFFLIIRLSLVDEFVMFLLMGVINGCDE
jgi:hypothetical protein